MLGSLQLVATIPQMVGHIGMLIVDTRINDSDDDTCTGITLRPNLVSVDL